MLHSKRWVYVCRGDSVAWHTISRFLEEILVHFKLLATSKISWISNSLHSMSLTWGTSAVKLSPVGAILPLQALERGIRGGVKAPMQTSFQRLRHGLRCRAQSSRSSSNYYGYDLYELLGVETSASLSEIKKAYRWLQKRCHPDVAGEVGHDMSILLNEAYGILSNPLSRSSYDAVRAEWIHYEGFTGEPLYSRWFGPASEQRAVFVDEIRCIGCLKCALICPKSFAIEKQYGRARAVAQWADPEPIIEDAIRACPVDCISWVDRSKLAALEYLMSKQPRFAVNVDAEKNAGERVIDVFESADRFLKKNDEFQAQKTGSPAQRHARRAAADAIQARAGRWWHFFVGKGYSSQSEDVRSSQGAIVPLSWFTVFEGGLGGHEASTPFGKSAFSDSKLKALYEAAAQRRLGATGGERSLQEPADEYWVPPKAPVSFDNSTTTRKPEIGTRKKAARNASKTKKKVNEQASEPESLLRGVPLVISLAAGLVVWITNVDSVSSTSLPEAKVDDISGPLQEFTRRFMLQELSTSMAMQAVFAAVAWYVISTLACAGIVLVATFLLDDHKES